MAASEEKINEKGQAIFELILFMPFLIYFVTILFNSGSAINGSINQQKATRGYFYSIVRGNSMLPARSNLTRHAEERIASVGSFSIGWAEKKSESGAEQFGTCYKYSRLYSSSNEICDEKAEDETSSIYVKPLTFYGVCSATYILRDDNSYSWNLSSSGNQSCTLSDGT